VIEIAAPRVTTPAHDAAYTVRGRAVRQVWNLVWLFLFRPTPRPLHAWRCLLLRCFGATIGRGAHVYAGARIWAPWNLVVGDDACIADGAEIYNPRRITLGERAVVSQGAYLCGASHDYTQWTFPLVAAPIDIGAHAWVAARAIVHMGVTVGEGTVIGAGSVVTRSMPAWTVCAGNPCRPIRPYEKR
jgi:putative colanic acid biosynthesis acetyltransferase WcaF